MIDAALDALVGWQLMRPRNRLHDRGTECDV